MKKIGFRIAAGAMAIGLLQGTVWGAAAEASPWTGPAAAMAGGGMAQAFASANTSVKEGRYTDYEAGTIPKAIQQTSPSVVAIIGKHTEEGQEAGRFDLAHGTGVIVSSDGSIITNAHVVKEMDHIVVVTYDGKQYNGKVTHLDEESDLALVQIEAAGLKEAVFAAKSETQVGETVIAIGTPISFSLRNSVTVGVISGLDRSVNSTYRLLQTDAAINPGNSGGALVNLKGEVVGINTLKYADYGVENLGFAIPADTVQYVLKHFLAYGKVKRPYVGIELEESWAAVVGIPSEEPLAVSFVEPESPADKAGIRADNKLLAVGGNQVKTLVEFNELLKRYLPGESAEFTLESGGNTVKRTVVFGESAQNSSNSAVPGNADDSAFDADAGKTRIGDSQFGWSMKYPSGLSKYYQSPKGNSVTLGDAKGEYSLHVEVEETLSEFSKSALLKALTEQSEGNTILDRKYVDGKNGSYARVISKDGYGYYESRAYVHEQRVYYISLVIHEERDYMNGIKRKGYTDLLNSFSLTFDAKDTALKDLAVNKDGYQRHIHEDYGYSVSVPSEWSTPFYSETNRYSDPNGGRYVKVYMASMAEGDTLEKWAGRAAQRKLDRYVAGYIESVPITDTKLAGLPAKEWTVSETFGDKWNTTRYFFLESQGYKYRLEIGFPKDAPAEEAEALVSKVKESFELNGSRNEALGYMEDEEDLVDYANTVTIRNKTFGYTMEAPEFWDSFGLSSFDRGGVFNDTYLNYHFLGGSFSVVADKEDSYEDAVKENEEYHKKSKEADADYIYAASDETVFGAAAKKFVVHYETKKIPYELIQYIFRINDVNYLVSMRINDAVRTETNVQDLYRAFESIRFNKE